MINALSHRSVNLQINLICMIYPEKCLKTQPTSLNISKMLSTIFAAAKLREILQNFNLLNKSQLYLRFKKGRRPLYEKLVRRTA